MKRIFSLGAKRQKILQLEGLKAFSQAQDTLMIRLGAQSVSHKPYLALKDRSAKIPKKGCSSPTSLSTSTALQSQSAT